jgi:hypothetical protein
MTILFFIPLTIIAMWESLVESGSIKNRYMASWLLPVVEENDDTDDIRNPKMDHGDRVYEDGENGGEGGEELRISKKSFDELTSVFPDPIMASLPL